MTPTRTTSLYTLAGLALARLAVRAEIIPTAPWGSVVDRTGSACEIQWNLDTTGEWTNFSIYLNSGSNQAFEQMTTVATGLDGTTGEGKYTWTCPEVTPNAKIYFYSFANGGGVPTTWTTRFTIADASGNTVEPAQATQPDGSATPWGVGTIAGGNSGAGSGTSGSGSSGSSSGSSGSSAAAGSSGAVQSSSSSATLVAPTSATMIRSTISSAASSASSSLSSAAAPSAEDTADTTVITVSPPSSRTTGTRPTSTGVINNQANNGTSTTTGGATASAHGSVAGLGLALALLAGFVVA